MNDIRLIWEAYKKRIKCLICHKFFQNKGNEHCPYCLCSIHLDIKPGDRKSDCHGILKPISRNEKEIIHKCEKCSTIQYNPIHVDDDLNVLK